MRTAASCFGFLCCAAFARTALAESAAAPRLSVERAVGAETCPDEAALAARIEVIRGRAPSEAAAYHVRFARERGALTATIQLADDPASARVLKAEEPSCDALAQATAVTLSLLIDATLSSTPPEAPPKPPQRRTAEAKAAPVAPVRKREATETAAALALGGAALFGVTEPVAPVFSAELALRVSAFRASLGAVWMVPAEHSLGPGRVDERLSGGIARLCLTALRRHTLRFDACSGAWLARRVAEGRDFSENTRSATTWLGVPLELSLTRWSSPIGWEISAGALLSFPRRTYFVPGFGSAYDSPPIAAVLALRGFLVWPW